MPQSPIHLLVTTFVTPNGLSRYKLGHAEQRSAYFRATRFLTSMRSISGIEWKSVTVFLEIAAEFEPIEESILEELRVLFPNLNLENYRLDSPARWSEALGSYADDDLVLLNANDDHALVPGGQSTLNELAEEMLSNEDLVVGLVTHFPEFSGYASRERLLNKVIGDGSLKERVLKTDNALGTTLVRAKFAKSWFKEGKFESGERIVRPDNPFGRSVRFDPVNAILPKGEVFRHLDGYSHIGLFKPVPPLRSSYFFDESGSLTRTSDWSQGYWPSKLITYAGRGVDLYLTQAPGNHFLSQVSVATARLKLHWGLRTSLSGFRVMRMHPTPIPWAASFCAVFMFAISPSGARAILDSLVLDPLLILLLRLVQPWSATSREFSNHVWALGTSRASFGFKLASKSRR